MCFLCESESALSTCRRQVLSHFCSLMRHSRYILFLYAVTCSDMVSLCGSRESLQQPRVVALWLLCNRAGTWHGTWKRASITKEIGQELNMYTYIGTSWTNVTMQSNLYLEYSFNPDLTQTIIFLCGCILASIQWPQLCITPPKTFIGPLPVIYLWLRDTALSKFKGAESLVVLDVEAAIIGLKQVCCGGGGRDRLGQVQSGERGKRDRSPCFRQN